MNLIRKILWLLLIIIACIALYFGWRYFFDPKGISIADGEICTTNETDNELVFSVEAKPGAKIIALLGKGERQCAPSPEAKPVGVISVGETEADLRCEIQIDAPDRLPFLTKFSQTEACDWGYVLK